MTRRSFLKRTIGALGGAILGALGWSYVIEPRRVQLETMDVPVAGLPSHLDGFRIGFLTDLHMGPFTSADQVRGVCQRMAELKPDLTLLGGDLISDEAELPRLAYALEVLGPAYTVIGNWDFFHADEVRRSLPPEIRLLRNEGLQVAPGLWLGGTDDHLWSNADVTRALSGAPDDSIRILLAHEPDVADLVRPEHRVAVQISGHSHGGQVRLPGLGPLLLPPWGRKYHTGWNQAPACPVYTSRGLGMSTLPVRLFCPPEMTLFTLRTEV